MKNEYGLDYKYFEKNLTQIGKDCSNRTPEEMARALGVFVQIALDQVKFHAEEQIKKYQKIVDNL